MLSKSSITKQFKKGLKTKTSCDYSDYSDFGSCSHITSCQQTLSVTVLTPQTVADQVDGTYSLVYNSMQPSAIYMRQQDPVKYIHFRNLSKNFDKTDNPKGDFNLPRQCKLEKLHVLILTQVT